MRRIYGVKKVLERRLDECFVGWYGYVERIVGGELDRG